MPGADASRRRTHSTPLAVAAVLGGFTFIAVLSVIAIGAWTSYRNTVDLLREKGELVVGAAVERMHLHLSAVEEQVAFLAGSIERRETNPDDVDQFTSLISGALAATPQLTALHYIDLKYRLIGAERENKAALPVFAGLALDPDARQIIEEARTRTQAWWADLLWKDEYQSLQVNLRYPVRRDGELIGVMMALISVQSLSTVIGNMEGDFGYNAFILVDKERVLAHPLLQFGVPGLDRWHPLPDLRELGDPVLMGIWDPGVRDERMSDFLKAESGHVIRLGENSHVIVYDEVSGYGPRPWIFGSHLRAAGLAEEVPRLLTAIAACAVLLLIVVGGAAYMGSRIARPARRLARAAEDLRRLPVNGIPAVGGSIFRELNNAGTAFDALAPVVRSLAAYAPRDLITRLAARGIGPETPPRRVIATFMALDISSSTRAEGPHIDIAASITQALNRIAGMVQEAGGTFEGWAGARLVAWWEHLPDQPDNAAKAVSVTQKILRIEARRVASSGLRISIGLHTGEGTAGYVDVGGRSAYILTGEAALVASDLREYAAVLPASVDGEGNEAVALASAHTVHAAAVSALSVGQHLIAGQTTESFRLM